MRNKITLAIVVSIFRSQSRSSYQLALNWNHVTLVLNYTTIMFKNNKILIRDFSANVRFFVVWLLSEQELSNFLSVKCESTHGMS